MSNFEGHAGTRPSRGGAGAVGWGLLALSLVCSAVPARAEYRVDAGDVIEIFVARVPELRGRVTVKPDGRISFPLLGTVAVAGLSPSQLQAEVQATLANKVVQQRILGGREIDVVIEPNEITATVVEYRPIYVNGGVSKPGEYPYRLFMTVRQAVAVSGGYDFLRARMTNPYFESADLRGDYESLWSELARERAHVWRIKSELGDRDNVDSSALMDVPVSRSAISEIVKVETEQLTVNLADQRRQKAFLQRSINQGNEQIAVLTEQQQKEDEGVRADAEELQKVLDLYGKGTLPSLRVTDARRAVLLSSTRKLQTTAQLMQMKRQQDELLRQMERLDDQRRIDLLRELQEAGGRVRGLQTKLQSIGEKLQYTTGRSQLVRGNDVKADITVIRKGESGRQSFAANEDSELQPGDVVEVVLRLDNMAGMNARGATTQTESASPNGAAFIDTATAGEPASGPNTVIETGAARHAHNPAAAAEVPASVSRIPVPQRSPRSVSKPVPRATLPSAP